MSKPESIKVEPWADYPRQQYSIFSDDFVHDKLAVAKVNLKGSRSTVNIKETVSADKGGYALADQVKLWFSLPSEKSFYAKLKSNNYIKLHYDNGVIQQFGKKWNLYATMNASKSFQNISLRLGASHIHEHCNSDNRVKVSFGAEGRKDLTWYHRTVVKHNKLTFGVVGAYEITKNIISKNNLLFGYAINSRSSAFVRLENEGFRKAGVKYCDYKNFFDYVKLDYLNSFDQNTKFGLEATLSVRDKPIKDIQVVVQRAIPEHKVTTKVRVSSRGDAALLVKFPSFLFKNIATTSVGLGGSSLHTQKRSFKYGGQIEFNV